MRSVVAYRAAQTVFDAIALSDCFFCSTYSPSTSERVARVLVLGRDVRAQRVVPGDAVVGDGQGGPGKGLFKMTKRRVNTPKVG